MCLILYIDYVNTCRGVISERYWNKKSQPLLPQINTNLTMICGPKYLYENSIIQLRIFTTPHVHKAKNTCIDTVRREISLDLHRPSLKLTQFSTERECTTS